MTQHTHFRDQVLRVALAMLSVAGASGCPRELEIPDAAGPICGEHPDCNPGATCGTLRACVLGHCEQEPSLLVPCDGGALIDAFVPDVTAPDAAAPDAF